MFLLMGLQYLGPNLTIYLVSFGYTPDQAGLFFAIPGVIYAGTSPFMYLLTGMMTKRGIMLFGFFIMATGMLMIGGSDKLW